MTPAARVQAAIEILDRVIESAQSEGAPADRIVADWARANRYAGSKDRRAVRELVYSAIRACGPIPQSGRAAMLRLAQRQGELQALFDGSPYGPAPVGDADSRAEGGVAPAWLTERLAASGIAREEAEAMLDRAPLDIRVNALKAERDTIELPEVGEQLAAPQGIRFRSGAPVEQWSAYRDGLIEVQDHGSQWACHAIEAKTGETVVDLCAGAGGKSLALAAAMDNHGVLIASDTDKRRLGNLPPRAERAGAGMVTPVLLDPGCELDALAQWRGKADAVLIDAPCSGTGTWRRKPEAKWRLTPERLARFSEVQDRLLNIAAQLVRPGGRLAFVTCSLLDEEGADRIARFLDVHDGWSVDPVDIPVGRPHGNGRRLSPYHDGTDGFFIAGLASPC